MTFAARKFAPLALVAFIACAAAAFAAEYGLITPERAQEIALAQTGGGQIALLIRTGGGPNQFYKVEVVNNNSRYHLQIDAFTGHLRKYIQKSHGPSVAVPPPAGDAAAPGGSAPVSREQALAIAQQMTGGGAVVESKMKTKRYGQTVYEFEIVNNGAKYEIEIDGFGNVLEFEQEGGGHVSLPPAGAGVATGSRPRLDMAGAVEIAKRHTNGGSVTDYELDSDDNRLVHEISLVNGGSRYEVEIDDATGEIVKLKQK